MCIRDSLYPADIDTHLRRAAVRAAIAKTRQGRTVFFSEPTARHLDRLIEVRPWDGSVPVFCTCLLYTSDAADDLLCVDLGGRRIIKKKKTTKKKKQVLS